MALAYTLLYSAVMMRTHVVGVLATALSLSACGHTEAARPKPLSVAPSNPVQPQPVVAAAQPATASAAPAPAPEAKPAPAEPLDNFMLEHFVIAAWARDAVIAGNLEAMREPLQALADYRYDTVKVGAWSPWLSQLQEAARLTAQAGSLDAAATGVATMARVCGECHRAQNVGPHFPPPAGASRRHASDTVPQRMLRHAWASEQLWNGLVGPSEEAWQSGAAALKNAPVKTTGRLPAGCVTNLLEVRQLGVDASEATTLQKRSDVYGLLIASCAECHAYQLNHDF